MPGYLKPFLKPHFVIGAVAVVAVGSVGYVFLAGTKTSGGAYSMVQEAPITQEVDAQGSVQAAESIDLSFQTSGRIAIVNAPVGSTVSTGQTLAALDTSGLQAQLEQAQAGLAAAQAQYASLQAGATPQTIAQAQTSVANAQNSLTQAKQSLLEAAQNAYVEADDAINNRVNQFINNPYSSQPSLAFNLTDSQVQSSIVSGSISMQVLLSQWETYLQSLPSDADDINPASVASTTADNLTQVSAYLDIVAAGLNEVVPNANYSTATIQGYQTSVATARANISGAISALDTAQIAETAAESGLSSAQAGLTVTQAPPTQNALDAEEAAVEAAQASVDVAQSALSNAYIVAPIDGVITVNSADVGATAVAGTPLISMDSATQFQFIVYVSEADLGKLAVGDQANVMLDAYPNVQPFSTHLISIDPSATIQNGVPAYKVTLQFDSNDSRVLAGLTGTASIITQTASSTLVIPTSAVITNGTSTYVLKQSPSGDVLTPIQIGISSASGTTQIISGLSQGDEVESFGNQ